MHSGPGSAWKHNRPTLSRQNAVAGWGVGVLLILGAATALAIGSDMWLVCVFGLAIVEPPFVLVAYRTGPASGWRGMWSLRVPKLIDDVLPRVLHALESAHPESRVREPDHAPRWLRNARYVVETREGFRIWLIPGMPGSPAGLNPRFQPLTTVVVDPTAVTVPHNTRRLRALLTGQVLTPDARVPAESPPDVRQG